MRLGSSEVAAAAATGAPGPVAARFISLHCFLLSSVNFHFEGTAPKEKGVEGALECPV